MDREIVISGFDLTSTMVQPWAAAGYDCYCVDLQHPPGETPGNHPNITLVGADMLEWLPPRGRVAAQFYFPPCTDWFKDKGIGAVIGALQLFERSVLLAEWAGAPYCIENPVSTISSYWRKPDYTFNPNDYGGYLDPPGDAYTKKTCLWTGNDFEMPPTKSVEPTEGSKMHLLPPGPERANLRSATPAGFANAVFLSNSNRSH